MSGRARDSQQARRKTRAPTTDDEARRTLEVSEKLYFRIGEVSKLTGVKAHVLRYWETEFRWMTPPKSRSRQRLYRKRDIEFVWLLKKLLWEERYTIQGARQRIQELGIERALALLRGDAPDPSDAATGPEAGDAGSARLGATETPTATVPAPSASESAGASALAWSELESELGEIAGEIASLRALLQESA